MFFFCFFLKRSKFRQILIIRVLVRNLRAQSEIGNHERDQQFSVQSEPIACVEVPELGKLDHVICAGSLVPFSSGLKLPTQVCRNFPKLACYNLALCWSRPGKSCESSSSGKFRATQSPQNSVIYDNK